MTTKTNTPSKTATILKLLRRPNGATAMQLGKATGWQPHSVRAALTGLRKKEHKVERRKNIKGDTIYCVVSEA